MSTSLAVLRRLLVAALTAAAPASAVFITATPPALAQAGEEIDLEVFYRELQPYGEWFRHERWGEVWRPNVDASWRPYTRGHWAWTEDHGWMWVAEEEWGWAVFHYGRWVFDENEDFWIWIPGSQWAPAWVQWRESEDQVGWAPLPPDSYLDNGVMRLNASSYDSARFSRYWVFAPPRYMFEPGLNRHLSPVSRQGSFFRSTRPVTVHHHLYRGNIYHPGPDWRRVERWAGRPVPIVSLRAVNASRDQGWRRMGSNPSVLPIYRPRVLVEADRTRRPLPNVDPRPQRESRWGDSRWGDWRRRDDRPNERDDGRDRRPDGRPSQPDDRLGRGGWQPVGRPPQTTPPGGQPRPADRPSDRPGRPDRPDVRPDVKPDVRTERPGRPSDRPTDRPGRPTVQPEPPRPTVQPDVRPGPGRTAGPAPAPTPWAPPTRTSPPQPLSGSDVQTNDK